MSIKKLKTEGLRKIREEKYLFLNGFIHRYLNMIDSLRHHKLPILTKLRVLIFQTGLGNSTMHIVI